MERMIYKICDAAEWAVAERLGRYTGAEIDLKDGYIHFSTASQLSETLSKHFAGREGLVLVRVGASGLGEALRWEPSRGGDLFPHLYGDLNLEHVVKAEPLQLRDGRHVLPGLECK